VESKNKNTVHIVVVSALVVVVGIGGIFLTSRLFSRESEPTGKPVTANTAVATPITPTPASAKPFNDLVKLYKDLLLTDTHNHDASGSKYRSMTDTWENRGVSRVVLFGDISEPSAIETDKIAWTAYEQNPQRIVPFFSGFDLHDKSSLDVVKDNLEKGYFGLGEIAGASTFSPVVSKVKWKANDPMDGFLPQIYDLCAQYKAPILLHIDPPNGLPVIKLEEALDSHPDSIFIFAHINAYNSPANIEKLLKQHKNLYADFFAGFTDLNAESGNKLEDFVPVIKQFPDRFLLSTDSGFGLPSEEAAIQSMYRVIDLLGDRELGKKIAHGNFDALLRVQQATKTQLDEIRKLGKALTKLEAGRILIENKKG
jgi:predicted TIM-barrel fold metal-dependent hydrolase